VDDYYVFFFVLGAVFAGAGAVKGVRAIRAGEPYRFSGWEGALFSGKMLTRNATQLKTGLSIAVVVGCALYVAGIRSPGLELAMGGLIIMTISDLAGRKAAT
jgi:hypothetical protein